MKILQRLFLFSSVLFVLYFIINLIHLTWSYVSPEGIWSFWLFTDVLRIVLITVVILFFTLYFFYVMLMTLLTSFKKGFVLKNFVEPLVILVVSIIAMAINVSVGLGPSIFISKKMSDKYSYLNRTEKLMDQGEFIKAEDEALNAYTKLNNQQSGVNQLFILSNLAHKKGYILTPSFEEKYGIIVNYAYCTQKIRKDLSEAKRLYEQAIHLIEQEKPSDIEGYKIFPLLQISEIELQKKNYAEAEYLFREIKNLGDNIEGDEFMLYYYTIYGRHSLKSGDHFKANQLFTEAYEYYLTTDFPQKNALFRSIAIKATDSHLALGNLEKAGEILVEITSQMNKKKDRAEYLLFLNVRAMYCLIAAQSNNGNKEVLDRGSIRKIMDWLNPKYDVNMALVDKGLKDLKEASTLTKKKEGENSLGYASSLILIGRFYEYIGNQKEAKTLYTQANLIIKGFKDVDYDMLHQSNLNLSRVDFHLGDRNENQKRLTEIDEYIFSKIRGTFPFLTEDEREKFVISQDYGLSYSNAIYTLTDKEKYASKIYDNLIASKGLALVSNIKFRTHLSQHPQLMEEYLDIIKQNEDLSEKEIFDAEAIKIRNIIEQREKDFLNRVQKILNIELVELIPNMARLVKDALDDNEVAIEIYSIPTSKDFKDSTYYYGVIIKKDYPDPKIVPLFSEGQLKSALESKGEGFIYLINKIYGDKKTELLDLVWSKLEKETIGKDKVYLSVGGLLHGIPLPSLLIDKSFDLVLLSSTKNLMNKDQLGIKNLATASVFGDPDFENTDYVSFNSSRGLKIEKNSLTKLPHSRAESIKISEILKEGRNADVRLFLDQEASEANFKNLKKEQAHVLHLATHGFYNKDQTKPLNGLIKIGSQNPLLSTTLFLAGTAREITSNSFEDGIITAMDISKMNFSDTELVVLSACETGLGEVIGSEGLFGMQRAFKIAGAKSVMMSLWQVPDSQTSELMQEFYLNLSQGKSMERSLKAAQLMIREKYKDPIYWAGFVLISA